MINNEETVDEVVVQLDPNAKPATAAPQEAEAPVTADPPVEAEAEDEAKEEESFLEDDEAEEEEDDQKREEDPDFDPRAQKKDNKEQEKAVTEIQQLSDETRHKRLMHLLDTSSIYVNFLLQRIEEEEKEPKSHIPKTTRKPPANSLVKTVKDDEGGSRRASPRAAKRKKETSNVADVLDKEDLIKRQRLNEEGDSKKVESEGRSLDGKEISDRQPHLLTGAVLREYQLYGVTWLKTLHENGMNGILADEMGLGKTIQSIGMIAKLIEQGVSGPFLCVAPLSTLPNWEREFQTFAPEIPIVLFHASKDDRPKLYKLMKKHKVRNHEVYPVIITSYEMCTIEFKFLNRWEWKYVVVDEGHKLKNINCRLIKTLKAFKSENRLLLTGTPLQNNLSELWALLNFILPDIFNDLEIFQRWFDFSALNEEGGKEKIVAQEKEDNVLSKLHKILKPFLLRRLKTDVELSIPSKTEVHVYASMSAVQDKYYRAILDRKVLECLLENDPEPELEKNEKGLRKTRKVNYDEDKEDVIDENGFVDASCWNSIVDTDTMLAKYTATTVKRLKNQSVCLNLKVIWVQLKKCCNHPYLLAYPSDEHGYATIDDNVFKVSGKMLLLDRMLPTLIDGGHKILIFSTMTKLLDIVEDYLSLRDWKSCRLDGSTGYKERAESIHNFQTDPEYKIFLLSTRAGGLGLNLMAADTVIILDSDWNPQCDLQAQDRAHRIGQKNKVMVYRFLSKNTMDQKIVERAMGKRLLEKLIIHKGKFKNHSAKDSAISEDDLQELFKCDALDALQTDYTAEDILSDADLNALTDRDNPLPVSKAYCVVESFKSCTL